MDSLLYKELAEIIHLIKARQTTTLRHVVDEAMTAWRDSKGQHEVIHERATKDGTYQEVTKTWLAGNLAYLATVLKELEDIRKVWGAESPKQVHVEAEVQPVSPREQLTRIGQHMRQLMPEVVAEVVGGDVDANDCSSSSSIDLPSDISRMRTTTIHLEVISDYK